MSKDLVRVISAVVMICIVIGLVMLGSTASFFMLAVVGTLVLDEIVVNFLKHNRFGLNYLASQLIYLGPVLGTYFYMDANSFSNQLVVHITMLMNIGLLVYLFLSTSISYKITDSLKKLPFFVGFYISLNIFSLSFLFFHQAWWQLATVLLFITYGMDSGAWLFGKNFGKHKLWPKVSPNKTIEGLIGGMFSAGVLGGITYHLIFGEFFISQFFVFCLLGAISQIGDLLQSRVKREVGIKDSSNLIPGHGGVFDRVDSLFFLTPFYLVLIQYYLS